MLIPTFKISQDAYEPQVQRKKDRTEHIKRCGWCKKKVLQSLKNKELEKEARANGLSLPRVILTEVVETGKLSIFICAECSARIEKTKEELIRCYECKKPFPEEFGYYVYLKINNTTNPNGRHRGFICDGCNHLKVSLPMEK